MTIFEQTLGAEIDYRTNRVRADWAPRRRRGTASARRGRTPRATAVVSR